MIREGRTADMSQITHVRTSVRENHLSVEQMAERGITLEGIVADLAAGHLGCWVAEDEGRVVAFFHGRPAHWKYLRALHASRLRTLGLWLRPHHTLRR